MNRRNAVLTIIHAPLLLAMKPRVHAATVRPRRSKPFMEDCPEPGKKVRATCDDGYTEAVLMPHGRWRIINGEP